MSVAFSPSFFSLHCHSRPLVQALSILCHAVASLFFRVMGFLCSIVGARDVARTYEFAAMSRENQMESLGMGLWYFGRRFLVSSDNHGRSMSMDLKTYQEKGYCRGACYWLIEKSLRGPHIPIAALALEFEGGMPEEVALLHDAEKLPNGLREEPLWAYRLTEGWEKIPSSFSQGIYSFRIGFWKGENEPIKVHRFVLFKGSEDFLFDPSLGLAFFEKGDWVPQLKRTAQSLDPDIGGFFTIECFRHSLTF